MNKWHWPLHTKPTSLVADGDQTAAFPFVVLHHGGWLAPELRVPPLLHYGKTNGHSFSRRTVGHGRGERGIGKKVTDLGRRSSPCQHGRSPGVPAAPASPPASPINSRGRNNRWTPSPPTYSPAPFPFIKSLIR
jgi:hypothetical protein